MKILPEVIKEFCDKNKYELDLKRYKKHPRKK